jgi:hypothetical protein
VPTAYTIYCTQTRISDVYVKEPNTFQLRNLVLAPLQMNESFDCKHRDAMFRTRRYHTSKEGFGNMENRISEGDGIQGICFAVCG